MKIRYILFLAVAALLQTGLAEGALSAQPRETVSLNGEWAFEQTEKAFPPKKFTRKIPVPGLVHLATPRISQYDKFFKSDHEVVAVKQHNFLDIDYTPMYNWYSRKVRIDEGWKDRKVILNITKSQYVTMVWVNGMFTGRAIECYTPIKLNITDYLLFGKENEILIMVGDRAWLPSEAAGSTDKEKVRYLPGIWDDVYLTATGELAVDKALFLPSLEQKKVDVKVRVSNMNPPQMLYGSSLKDECTLEIRIKEKASGRLVASASVGGQSLRDNKTQFQTSLSIPRPEAWSPERPFLYTGEIDVVCNDKVCDRFTDDFGIRDFKAKGRFFYLNGKKYYLRGSNVTLQRFFEDPECSDLAWNREWVKKMLIDNPKSIDWNAMRICVGIVPDFWYDLCDEYGILLQNEWFYWQKHGWNEQIRKEYTDWVWSDGNHPSIVIWDGINENWDDFIGNVLIPELKQLDPTRVWDAGYMTSGSADEMDEPHPYRSKKPGPYNIGQFGDWTGFENVLNAGVPQLVNEYGWIWLWRDGRPAKLTVGNYEYYLGKDATPEERRALQAYWLQMETEWIRVERSIAGVLAFCMLTNNYGFTGDWYIGPIKDLEMSPTYKWFRHCFAPVAVFIDLPDSRYSRHIAPLEPGTTVPVNLVGVNDRPKPQEGLLQVRIYDSAGSPVFAEDRNIAIPATGKSHIPVSLRMPESPGGYLITAEFIPQGEDRKYVSRRYVRVGQCEQYNYYEIEAL